MYELPSPFDVWVLGAEIEDPVNPLNAGHLAHVRHFVVCQDNTSMHLKVSFSTIRALLTAAKSPQVVGPVAALPEIRMQTIIFGIEFCWWPPGSTYLAGYLWGFLMVSKK